MPEAYPGDVVGLVNPGRLAIGDTLYAGRNGAASRRSRSFPRSASRRCGPATVRHKRFDEAVGQLAEEGLLQVFVRADGIRHPIVGVVGALQFDVIEARLASEYGIACRVEPPAARRRAMAGRQWRTAGVAVFGRRAGSRSAEAPGAALRIGLGAELLRREKSRRALPRFTLIRDQGPGTRDQRPEFGPSFIATSVNQTSRLTRCREPVY